MALTFAARAEGETVTGSHRQADRAAELTMPEVALLDRSRVGVGGARQDQALSLARRLPSLVVAAREVAASVMHGVHGRRRAGIGETFWQFRPFVAGEPASRDRLAPLGARRAALRARARMGGGAYGHGCGSTAPPRWISPRSWRCSRRSIAPLVLGLAAADLLIRGGERVGLLGLTRPLAARNIVERFAEALLAEERGAATSRRSCRRRAACRAIRRRS